MSRKTKAEHHEPLVRIIRREDSSAARNIWVRLVALLAAFATGALLIVALGENPFAVYAQMLTGALAQRRLSSKQFARQFLCLSLPLALSSLLR